jgi:hypothetical protein
LLPAIFANRLVGKKYDDRYELHFLVWLLIVAFACQLCYKEWR